MNPNSKYINCKTFIVFFVYYLISFITTNQAFAQTNNNSTVYNNKFEVLRSQITIYSSYISLNQNQIQMLTQADSLSTLGEFEIGIIYLEEVLAGINAEEETSQPEPGITNNPLNLDVNNNYSISVISGIDFDRHEFEYGYETSDSTILEELNKPYIGLTADYDVYKKSNNLLHIYNSLRYDKENLRDDYLLQFAYKDLDLKYGGYLNRSFNSNYSSYWEHFAQFNYDFYFSQQTKVSMRNKYNYKIFGKSDLNYTDYYRNYFETTFDYKFFNYDTYVQYANEINEYLGNENNDYRQNNILVGYRKSDNWDFRHAFNFDYQIRDYTLLYGDSISANSFNQISLIADCDIKIIDVLSLQLQNQFIKKDYNVQSTFEPNYQWNYFRPGIEIDVLNSLQTGIGYEWEVKWHDDVVQDGFSSTEQDYNSDGIYFPINYFSTTGITFSFSLSYQWRRYPESPTNDLINLYSSRNVLSIIALGTLPVGESINISILAVYDNDKDIDNDQGNTQSSIFNIEFQYKL